MKKDIHPKYNEVTVTFTDGSKVKMNSTLSHDVTLDIDPKSHPAWTGGKRNLDKGGQVDKFKKKFAGFSLNKSKK